MSRDLELSVFNTPLGWFALAGTCGRILWCTQGHPSRAAAERHARASLAGNVALRDWHAEARRRLTAFAAGAHVTFDDLPLDLDGVPAFHRAVLAACRRIGYGRTMTYAQLARAAGRPRAVRAAGTAMARNPLPIIIPCHRVVRSDGGLGGYSAPQGVSLKARLLELEAAAVNSRTDTGPARSPRRRGHAVRGVQSRRTA